MPNLVDICIVLLAIGSLMRGYSIGLVRQAGSTIGFIVGLLLGSWISNIIVSYESSAISKSITSLLVVLAAGFICMTVGEIISTRAKEKLVELQHLNKFDSGLGSVMAATTVLFAAWLGASILVLGPPSTFQQELKSSRILSSLNSSLPPATSLLGSLNKLINPNGFPQVFRGLEPSPGSTTLPSLGSFDPVVQSTRASIVKVQGTGCGGIVEGTGFVVTEDRIATNAHVVAGVANPKVIDGNGVHNTRVVWFDSDLDLAVLQVSDLAGKPLRINTAEQPTNTPAVVLGYPGGGSFDAQPASIIDRFTAYGRDIYDQGTTVRDIYSVQARVIPGNSGGPLVGADGRVLGIVFATSTSYNDVGYVLTSAQTADELADAEQSTVTRGTGSCSE